MFDKLRNAFSSAVKSLGEKELKEKDIDEVLFELEIALLESDVATEVIDLIKSDLKKQLIGTTVQKDTIDGFVKQSLRESISSMFNSTPKIDILSNIQKKKEKGEPYIISFMGINGTGKTTTIAKFANLLRENKFSAVIAAADTYRAGAIEQITEHGKRLNIKVIAQNYGSDPAAVSRDAVLYAKSHKIDCVLIDTAGRMQTSKNLMDQISKINKVVNPDLKLFVGDSLAGNDTVSQAREFHNYTKFDGAILTKSDADARGGAAISIVKITSSPILYLGVGQEYKDLKPFDKDIFLESIFGQQESVPEIQQKEKTTHQPERKEFEEKSLKRQEPQVEIKEVKPEVIEAKTVQSPVEKVEIKTEKEVIVKPEPKIEPKPEPKIKQEVKTKPVEDIPDDDDPFAGIETKDIEKYSDLYDVPPPETDDEARKLASKIRRWISDGRPKSTKEDKKDVIEEEIDEVSEDEKPKKKRSMFGWMKK
ncbi:MAG TPA: signal recognition particle-docking protein FtsY [Candidatus Nitrosotalea sp.]|nr:signal recognition particle-docking protein FtsY [Candidatus Nitrosotalea sp.]